MSRFHIRHRILTRLVGWGGVGAFIDGFLETIDPAGLDAALPAVFGTVGEERLDRIWRAVAQTAHYRELPLWGQLEEFVRGFLSIEGGNRHAHVMIAGTDPAIREAFRRAGGFYQGLQLVVRGDAIPPQYAIAWMRADGQLAQLSEAAEGLRRLARTCWGPLPEELEREVIPPAPPLATEVQEVEEPAPGLTGRDRTVAIIARNIRQLHDQLQDNWDLAGAPAPSNAATVNSTMFLSAIGDFEGLDVRVEALRKGGIQVSVLTATERPPKRIDLCAYNDGTVSVGPDCAHPGLGPIRYKVARLFNLLPEPPEESPHVAS